MKKCNTKQFFNAVVLSTLVMVVSHAAEPSAGVIGKSEWLFYNYELAEAAHAGDVNVSLDLIQRFNKVLAANDVNLVVVIVPVKMRIYSEYLPDEVKINSYMAGNYDRMVKVLQAANVNTIDINSAFIDSPKRSSDTPLFFRLDTHWTPTGAMLAAETIKIGINANPALKAALDATPEEVFKLAIANRKRPSKVRDLVDQLPKNTITFAPEMVAQVNVMRVQPLKENFQNNGTSAGLAVVGGRYSMEWTGFTDALRFSLQKDIVVSIATDQGSWIGMERYLRDNSFQTKAPKIIFWEMPERDMRVAPDYRFRDVRYISNNTEWLLRASAWAQTSCKPSSVAAKLMPLGLAANSKNLKGRKVATGPTNDGDFIEFNFDKPVEKLDYLSALTSTAGSKSITLEASGPGVATRRFTMAVPGDDVAYNLKTPLPSVGAGFTKLRVFPGKNNAFVFDGLQLCRQPDDLLK